MFRTLWKEIKLKKVLSLNTKERQFLNTPLKLNWHNSFRTEITIFRGVKGRCTIRRPGTHLSALIVIMTNYR